jgi:hypothetical protein
MENIPFKIEHHFEKKYMRPATEQCFPSVPIVIYDDRGEFFIENNLNDNTKLDIGFGGLSVTLKGVDFYKGLLEYLCREEEHKKLMKDTSKQKLIKDGQGRLVGIVNLEHGIKTRPTKKTISS